MSSWHDLLASIGSLVTDSDEEAFLLFTNDHFQSADLGMFDPKAASLELTIAGHDVTLEQSPGVLISNRAAGSTGAALWRVTAALAEWLASPSCALFQEHGLSGQSAVVELGCGISGILACVTTPRVGKYIATDQRYVLKTFQRNYEANKHSWSAGAAQRSSSSRDRNRQLEGVVEVASLDWEHDDPSLLNGGKGVDAVLVSDCVFNETLIEPLVDTCVAICKVRQQMAGSKQTVCIIAQQLRSFEVFEMWTIMMMTRFTLYRIEREHLSSTLKQTEGFVLHAAVLKES